MKKQIILIMTILLLVLPHLSHSENKKSVIKVEGESYAIVKPNIAHYFLKISGIGENYKESTEKAIQKIEDMKKVFEEIMGVKPEISLVKRENKLKGKFYDDDFMEYQKEYFTSIAKAIKGEEIQETEEIEKKEMITDIYVYFSTEHFSEDKILQFKTIMAEKEIAFDKKSLFDFSIDFDIRKSSIFFGLKEPSQYLEKLAAEAYFKAKEKAMKIAKASNVKIGKLEKISGCGQDLEGTISISNINSLVGRDLGPLSADPNRLTIKFKKDYEFEIIK
jgi:hypothetical protein